MKYGIRSAPAWYLEHSRCSRNFFFLLFGAAHRANGGSQASQRGAAAASLHHSHSNTTSKLHLQHQIFNPLSGLKRPHGS